MRAQAFVARLEVETVVEIERWTILVELRANPSVIDEHEIDLLRTRQKSPLNCGGWHAFRPLLLGPFNLRDEWSGLDRNAKDHFILDDEASDRLANCSWLHADNTEQ